MKQRWINSWKLLTLTFRDHISPGLLRNIDQYRCYDTDELFKTLYRSYSENYRKYHTMDHLQECFEFYDSLPDLPGKSALTEMAIWFHDSVYYIGSDKNEEASANWAKYLLMDIGVFEELATKISNIILADHNSKIIDIEQQMLADIDLWILASPPQRFLEYERKIRKEYKSIPDEIYYPKRKKIMQGFLNKDHIYYDTEIRHLLENNARKNLSKYYY
jgi:predicted metal-dependent HD superfamily phosphohydrolase